jgi:hypothetical protein
MEEGKDQAKERRIWVEEISRTILIIWGAVQFSIQSHGLLSTLKLV